MAGTTQGKHYLWDVSMIVNGTDLSNRLEQVSLMVGSNKGSGAAMGDQQDYSMPQTLTVTDPKLKFFHDFAASKVYATFYALWAAQTIFNIVGKVSSGANATTNPAWTIPCFVAEMPLIAGQRGDRHMADVTLAVAGAISVATA